METYKLGTSESLTLTASARLPTGPVKLTSATWTPSDLTMVDVADAAITPDGLAASCRPRRSRAPAR